MLNGPQTDIRMKAMEPPSPMISVPAEILKRFVNSPASSNADSPKALSRTPSPDIPSKLSDPPVLPTDISNHVNGDTKESENISSVLSDNSNDKITSDNILSDKITHDRIPNDKNGSEVTTDVSKETKLATNESTKNTNDQTVVPTSKPTVVQTTELTPDPMVNGDAGVPEKRINGMVGSVKRPNEDEGSGESYPDLKKVRVFSEEKNKSIQSTVEEFNKHLDQESKKLESDQDEIMCIGSSNTSASAPEQTDNLSLTSDTILDALITHHLPSDKSNSSESKNVNIQKENKSSSSSDFQVLTTLSSNTVSTVKEDKSKFSSRLHKLPRKELEKIIMRLFNEKTLFQCELGKQKQLCLKLESTLEANRKKTSQFHKEVEDLKKVTNRLSAEQQSRKGQYVAPIRIKRSVGIQAAPHIINKGLQQSQSQQNSIKTIAPRAGMAPVPGERSRPLNPGYQTKIIQNSPNKVSTSSTQVGGLKSALQQTGRVQIPGSSLPINAAQAGAVGTIRPAMGQVLMMTQAPPTLTRPSVHTGLAVSSNKVTLPLVQGKVVPISNIIPTANVLTAQKKIIYSKESTATTNTLSTPLVSRGTGIVDLTSDEGRTTANRNTSVMTTPGTLIKVTNTKVPMQSGVQTVNPAVAQARTGTSSAPRSLNTSYRTSSTSTPGTSVSSQNRHPAPLPKTPVQQVAGINKKLPPQPTLKLSHKENSIVLSWTMAKTEDHESIASYQLYAYQEGNSPPNAALWKKVGSVKALELPMACTLTQFMPGHIYHFAVRAVDTKSRLGPFSDPKSIKLEKRS